MNPPHRWTATEINRAWRAVGDWERARRCPRCPAGRAAEAATIMLRRDADEAEAVETWHTDVAMHLLHSGEDPDVALKKWGLHLDRSVQESRRAKRLRALADRLEREGMPVRSR